MELVAALELAVSAQIAAASSSWSIRYVLGVARFMIGASARFNDIQHCCPKDIRATSNSIEVVAWQTKTTSVTKAQSKPCILICPQLSFSGQPWWVDFLKMMKVMSEHPTLQEMDYLLPTLGREGTGFIQRPGGYDRCLRWFRSSLASIGVDQELASSLSWHPCRVFIPHWAFQIGLPKDQRQYLGNWANENMADVYTGKSGT